MEGSWGIEDARSDSCVDSSADDCIKTSCLFGQEALIMSSIKCASKKRRSVDSNNIGSLTFAGTTAGTGDEEGQSKRSFAEGMVEGMEVMCKAGYVPDGVKCSKCKM